MAQPHQIAPNPLLIGKIRRLISDTGEPSTTVSGTLDFVFQDHELYEYLKDSVALVAIDVNADYYIDAADLITPTPSSTLGALLSLEAAILIREQLSQEGYSDGIYIKDGDTVIDTTRTLQYRGLGQERLLKMYEEASTKYLMGEDVGSPINTYNYVAVATGDV